MGFSFHVSGNQNNGTPRWYRILFDLVIIILCASMIVKTVPEQRLLVLPAFVLGIASSGVSLYKDLRQIYKERAGEDEPEPIRFCPYCGCTLHQNSETCNNCGKKLPK